MLGLQEYEESLCPCGCGQVMEDAHDPDKPWAVESFTCMAGRARELVEAKAREESQDHPEKLAGMHWYVRPYDPDRDLDRKGRRPTKRHT